MRLTKNIILIFVAILIIGSFFVFWLWQGYAQRKAELITREQEVIQNQYSSTINSYRLVSQSLYDEVLNSQEIIELMAEANQANDGTRDQLRAKLYQRLLPVYERLKNKNFKQLHFHLLGGTSFLRMQAPDKYGDNLLDLRPSLRQINASHSYVEGFEEDKYFSGFHYIFPLFSGEEYIGSVETSVSFNTFREQMRAIFPLTYQFLIRKNVLDESVSVDSSRYYFTSDLNRDYFYENEANPASRVDNVLPQEVNSINGVLRNKVAQKMLSGQQFTENLEQDHLNYLVSFIPIKNIGGSQVAYLLAYNKNDTVYNLTTDLTARTIYVLCMILVILAFVYFVSDNQNKLLDVGEQLSDITAAMGEGLMVVNKKGQILFFNQAACHLTGLSREEAIHKPYFNLVKFVSETKDSPSDKFINIVIDKGRTVVNATDLYLLNKKKEKFPIAISASPFRNKDRSIVGCIVVFRDVSEERAINKAKSEFVSLASHQLKTPLSAVSWYTEMLMDGDVGPVNDQQKDFLKEIMEGNQRMVKLINSLLNVSRIDMGTLMVVPEPVSLPEMADSLISELQFGIKAKELKVIKRYQDNFPKINLDPSLARIALQNLLTNAVKYTREGGLIELDIKKQDTKTALITVHDNGYGIPKDEQVHIFKKLFRADNVTSKKVEGTGLGLYVAKAVVEAFDGKIWFESEENVGTTFFITLPLIGVKRKEGTKGLEANT